MMSNSNANQYIFDISDTIWDVINRRAYLLSIKGLAAHYYCQYAGTLAPNNSQLLNDLQSTSSTWLNTTWPGIVSVATDINTLAPKMTTLYNKFNDALKNFGNQTILNEAITFLNTDIIPTGSDPTTPNLNSIINSMTPITTQIITYSRYNSEAGNSVQIQANQPYYGVNYTGTEYKTADSQMGLVTTNWTNLQTALVGAAKQLNTKGDLSQMLAIIGDQDTWNPVASSASTFISTTVPGQTDNLNDTYLYAVSPVESATYYYLYFSNNGTNYYLYVDGDTVKTSSESTATLGDSCQWSFSKQQAGYYYMYNKATGIRKMVTLSPDNGAFSVVMNATIPTDPTTGLGSSTHAQNACLGETSPATPNFALYSLQYWRFYKQSNKDLGVSTNPTQMNLTLTNLLLASQENAMPLFQTSDYGFQVGDSQNRIFGPPPTGYFNTANLTVDAVS